VNSSPQQSGQIYGLSDASAHTNQRKIHITVDNFEFKGLAN